jgi:ATP-dependent DNA helicase RecG
MPPSSVAPASKQPSLMRPSLLDPIFAPLTSLSGIGPKLAPLFDRLVGRDGKPARVVDMLLHSPVSAIDRSLRLSIREAPWGVIVTVKVTVQTHRPPPVGRSKAPYKVLVADDTADIELVFFNGREPQISSMLPEGATRWISGKLELFDGLRQMTHPDRILTAEQFAQMPKIEPVYPMTEGLGGRILGRAAGSALARLPELPEWIDPSLLAQRGWPSFKDAMRSLHAPPDLGALGPENPIRQRLAYDELLASQLAIVLVRARLKRAAGRTMIGDGRIGRAIRAALPFALTGGQEQALAEIERDMAGPDRMLRLLQGDVGSGKTVVGLLAMARAIEAGRQAAMMAPTEILARQHFERMKGLAEGAGLTIALLTGRDRAAERRVTLEGIASGAIQIVIGTHALFQDQVRFRDLGLAVVDEQHRFGVRQRLALSSKGDGVDLLVMTATPIPRTLVLTFFGDMDVSVLREKPAGRKPIDTRAVSLDRLEDMAAAIGRAAAEGRQIYWVCPLVAESELLDVAAAEERAAWLREHLPGVDIGLVHGQMPGPDKDAAVERFARGDTAILVSTTVIEVGVDVPNASIMVIEHAERFGLAQLHQLRGRVGRGAAASSCILLYKGPLGETAKARIGILRETEDGFRIAEEDLTLRGEGDVLGAKQSGQPGFRLADMAHHAALMQTARDDALLHFGRDPGLATPRGSALRQLLYLFERDEAVRLLNAG